MRKVQKNPISRQTGHAITSWSVATFALVVALFVPIPGADQSVVGIFMDSLRGFHENSSFLYSLP